MGKTEKQIVGRMIFRIVIAGMFLVALATAPAQGGNEKPSHKKIATLEWDAIMADPAAALAAADETIADMKALDKPTTAQVALKHKAFIVKGQSFMAGKDYQKMLDTFSNDYMKEVKDWNQSKWCSAVRVKCAALEGLKKKDELFSLLDDAVLKTSKEEGKTVGVVWGAVIIARRQNRLDKAYEYSKQYLKDFGNYQWNGAIRDTLTPENLTPAQKAEVRGLIRAWSFRASTRPGDNSEEIKMLDILETRYE